MALTSKSITGQGQDILANYDFVDFADGTGVVVFHGGATRTQSGGYKFELSRNGFYSDIIASGGNNAGTDDLKVQDFDFDVTFNQPRIIKGNAIATLPISVEGNVAASSYDAYTTIAVQKVSDGVETEIFALTSGSTIHTAQSFQSGFSAIRMNLPQTNFKRNDTLRLQVQLYARGNAADSATALLGMDSKNRTESGSFRWTQGDTDLQFHVPFKLDI